MLSDIYSGSAVADFLNILKATIMIILKIMWVTVWVFALIITAILMSPVFIYEVLFNLFSGNSETVNQGEI